MKFDRLIVSQAIGRLSPKNALRTRSFSTTPIKSQRLDKKQWKDPPWRELYHRISPIGDPTASIVPVLDKWVGEGRPVEKDRLLSFIRELRSYKRYSHALEISFWMSDKRFFDLTTRDVAIRLDLMTKVRGIEQAEIYFNNIPQQLKSLEVYGALLNCYVHVKSVEKAEALLQRMRELGFAKTSLTYNVMLTLYYQTGNIERLETLRQEMGSIGIKYDKFACSIILSAYASVLDIERMEKTMAKMEADPDIVLDWATYAAVATGYRKAGLLDKTSEMLKKSERLIPRRRRRSAYDCLITQYAAIGKKDEVLRLWELYKEKENVYNVGYTNMITSLLKFDDLETAEKVFEDWELQNLNYDMRIPNFLIGAYSEKGLLEKAESLVNRAMSKGGKPNARTWYCLAIGYLQNNQTPKAVEMMKKAAMASGSNHKFKPSPESLVACLEYLKGEGQDEVEEFINLLRDKNIISLGMKDGLLDHLSQNFVSLKVT